MKRILIGLVAVVFLLLIVGGTLMLRFESRWAAKIASLRAAGQPTSIVELKPAPVPNGQNAAAVLAGVAVQVEAFGREQEQFYKSPAGIAYEETAGEGVGPNAEQAAAMRAIVERYPDIAAAATRAAALDRLQFDLDYSLPSPLFSDQLLKHVLQFRGLAHYITWRIRLSAYDGKIDEAIQQGVELLRLGRLEDQVPTLISHLNAVAVQIVAVKELAIALTAGQASPQWRAALDAELASSDSLQPLAKSVVTERAFALSAIEQLLNGTHPTASRFLLWKPKGDFLSVVEYFDEMLPAVIKPWHELQATPGGRLIFSPVGLGPFADSFIPTVNAAYDASNRRVAVGACLRVLNALQAFAEANGREATGLDELNLPAGAMIDPFWGAPLIVKHTDRGWMVYSVYRDGKDDGGEFKGIKDAGIGPPQAAEASATEADGE